jgi:hypothetical protein
MTKEGPILVQIMEHENQDKNTICARCRFKQKFITKTWK